MKNKILIFVVGLFAGVTFGVLFSVAIKELLGQFKELHISLNQINVKQNQLSQRLDSIQGKLVPDTKTINSPKQIVNNHLPVTQQPQTPKGALNNSRQSSSASHQPSDEDSDVVVMTNQLVSVVSASLKNKDTVNKKNEKTDSTLESMSEVDNTQGELNYRIEFWKSPLNYKGYKMSRGKIVLYGINPESPVNVILMEDSYYLIVNQVAYRVDYTDNYKPFERVTDKTILKKLGA